ncbi:glycosyltransferase family 2 protein [Calidifontimicrobium sp. SYSU G02091]|uniref:glycosyltransferase family 2 protein n=1 Tax=Calidifontimicrobium sp. SYSU G02091 TaxID=2926421 RepID=UPI001F53D80C|nr:glycosyltransferase family 2 protein [Calidifontimicrobium sp. SYSU G02091]MCI1193651.1 glycosyltransferase family 2 protein [Calidifontimicrobium sp. SYSU G02091]
MTTETAASSGTAFLPAMAISLVKNEADLIEASVRHNLAFVDLMVVIDNGSTDGTREILQALRDEGLPLVVVDDPIVGHYQSEKVSHAYRMFAPVFNPALVYLLDADEFVVARDRAGLEALLRAVPEGGAALLPWRTYVPLRDYAAMDIARDPLGLLTARRRREEPLYHKAVIRRRASDDAMLVVDQGNHAVRLRSGEAVRHVHIDEAYLAHLPVRNVEQLTAKVVNGWHACQVRDQAQRVPGEAYQWQQLSDRILAGRPLQPAEVTDIALNYAQRERAGRSAAADVVEDPVPARYGTIRYVHLGRHSAVAKVALAMLASRQGGTGSQVPDAPQGTAIDLAPALSLLRGCSARTVAIGGDSSSWASALRAVEREVRVVDADDGSSPVELLILPALRHDQCLEVVPRMRDRTPCRIVWWPAQRRTPETVAAELAAWRAAGWAPDLMATMTYRALASYSAERHGAVVLVPAGDVADERAAVVRSLLIALEAAPHPWTDPAPQVLWHPLQTLHIAELGGRRETSHAGYSMAVNCKSTDHSCGTSGIPIDTRPLASPKSEAPAQRRGWQQART